MFAKSIKIPLLVVFAIIAAASLARSHDKFSNHSGQGVTEISGEVVAVNETQATLTVTYPLADETASLITDSFQITDKTLVTKKGDRVGLNDVLEGDQVTIAFVPQDTGSLKQQAAHIAGFVKVESAQ